MVDVLKNIEDRVYKEFNVESRPYGDTYIKMILAMSEIIVNDIPVEDLNDDIQAKLTDDNFHMVNHAVNVVRYLDKYSYRHLGSN